MYSQCSGLKGIGEFVIGVTTYNQVIHSEQYRYSYIYNNLYNGYWGVGNDSGRFSVSEGFEASTWIENHSSVLKQIATPIGGVKIGEIQLSVFDLAFYNNRLAAIYFKDEKGTLHEHYLKKYGDGRGTYNSYHLDNEPCKNRDKLFSKTKINEYRVWENQKVELTYKYDYYFEMGPHISHNQMVNSFEDNSWYLIASKSLYPKFLEELEKQKQAYIKDKSSKNQDSLNQF